MTGIFTAVEETTSRYVAERRLETLREVSMLASRVSSPAQVRTRSLINSLAALSVSNYQCAVPLSNLHPTVFGRCNVMMPARVLTPPRLFSFLRR